MSDDDVQGDVQGLFHWRRGQAVELGQTFHKVAREQILAYPKV
jgi:hypothetical protein